MARSPEYPDLAWVPPKSWTNANRDVVQLIVMHSTEGSTHQQSAEDGAAYDARRTDGTSTHYFHDSNSTVQCVHTADIAHTARKQGNRRGIQHELCAKAYKANWSDAYHHAMLRRAAEQAARDCRKWGIPVRKLTVQQIREGAKGFCGHVDITHAFPEDKGSHTDPGPGFPWPQFLTMVREELAATDAREDEDMPSAEEVAKAVWTYDLDRVTGGTQTAGGFLLTEGARSRESRTVIEPGQDAKLDAMSQRMDALAGQVGNMETALARALELLEMREPKQS
jgi:N-acetyl-anhydromuramyl-L-alanine amidase AmpD